MNIFRRALHRVPRLRRLVQFRHVIAAWRNPIAYPPGHFHSPLPSVQEVKRSEVRIFDRLPRDLPGIDLREASQASLLEDLSRYYGDLAFPARKTQGFRYHYENRFYSYSDAVFLFCMMRHFRPARIVEVGSGFSSGLMLDTNDRFFDGSVDCTFVEPNPERLDSLLRVHDRDEVQVRESTIQEADLSLFRQLEAGDFLFIDSTHVLKTDSDVNRVLFEILPLLRTGVLVHFHDVPYPFEYPADWVYEGRGWNEAYALRAFLMGNSSFEIVVWNSYLEQVRRPFLRDQMPLCLKSDGLSIWLRKAA